MLGYDSLKVVMRYLEANKRIELSRRCPYLRTVHQVTPMNISYLFMDVHRLVINGTQYRLGVYRDYSQSESTPPNQHLKENEEGGVDYDLDEYGEHDLSHDSTLSPGDLYIPPARLFREERPAPEEREGYFEWLRTRLQHLKSLRKKPQRIEEIEFIEAALLTWENRQNNINPTLPFKPYLMLIITKPGEEPVKEIVEYNKKMFQGMKHLYNILIGNRKNTINVFNMKISSAGGVFRLPENAKFRVQELFIGSNIEEVMSSAETIFDQTTIPDIGLTDGAELAQNFEHPSFAKAKCVILNQISVSGELFPIMLSFKNPQLDIQNSGLNADEVLRLLYSMKENKRKLGTIISLGIHSRKIIKQVFDRLKDNPDFEDSRVQFRGCKRFPIEYSLVINDFSKLTISCKRHSRYDGKNGIDPWILWIRVEWNLSMTDNQTNLPRIISNNFCKP